MLPHRRALCIFTIATAAASLSCERPPETPLSVLSPDGVPIHYEVHGSGEPALVLVHGWSCDRSYWDAQAPHFAAHSTVVTIDLAGHGESGLEREEWTMRAFGQDVAAVVEELELEQVVLVGHSMGGLVIVEAARILGDRVKVVVGADTYGDVSNRLSDEQRDGFLQPFRADFHTTTDQFVRNSFFVPASDSVLIDRIAADMSSAPSEVGIGALAEYINWYNNESAVAFSDLQVPVRSINSDYNPTNVEAGRETTSSFEVVLMSDVGHFVMMEDPETFNRLLDEIVQEFAGT